MRCLHVSAAYKPVLGGAEAYLKGLSERLVREHHAVTVLTTDAASAEYFWMPAGQSVEERSEIHNGVSIFRYPVRHLPLSPYSFYALRRLAMGLSPLPFSTPFLLRGARYMPWVPTLREALAIKGEEFDLVHAVNLSFESLPLDALEYAEKKRIPFLFTPFLHLGATHRDRVFRSCTMGHQWGLLKRSTIVIVQSGREKEILIKGGVDAHRIEKVGMAVDLAEIRGGNGQTLRERYRINGPLVAFLGRVHYDKGAIHLVEAMRRLWEEGRGAALAIAGPIMDDFRRYYDPLPQEAKDRMRLLGPLGEEKRDLLAAADMLVLPSRVDSFGLVFLEAWAYRKPVIGAAAGGIPEVIDEGSDGFLVPFGDVKGLAERIATLLDNRPLAERMGEEGYRKVIRFYTWDVIFPRLEKIYLRLVG